jgi:hypothetical protein
MTQSASNGYYFRLTNNQGAVELGVDSSGNMNLHGATGGKTFYYDNASGNGTGQSIFFALQNSVASTSGATQQYSPAQVDIAHVWNTTSTAADNYAQWLRQVTVTSGTSPTSAMIWYSSISATSAPSYTQAMSLTSGGNVTFAGNISTAAPSGGTAAAVKFGIFSGGGAQHDIAGTLYHLTDIGTANTWTAKQTMTPGATVAGLNVGSVSSDPSTPVNGDLWYNSTGNVLNARINGATVALGSGGGGVSLTAGNGTLTASPSTITGTGSYVLNLSNANKWLAAQTFTNSDLLLLGSSTGATTFTSANAGSSNYTLTFPAATDTVAVLGTAQTWTAAQVLPVGSTISGTTSGTNAASGKIGEVQTAQTLRASAVSLTSSTSSNVVSLTLPAGDWDVSGSVGFAVQVNTTIADSFAGGISTTSGALPGVDSGQWFNIQIGNQTIAGGSNFVAAVPTYQMNLSTSTTIYLVAFSVFGTGPCSAYGTIYARRSANSHL